WHRADAHPGALLLLGLGLLRVPVVLRDANHVGVSGPLEVENQKRKRHPVRLDGVLIIWEIQTAIDCPSARGYHGARRRRSSRFTFSEARAISSTSALTCPSLLRERRWMNWRRI